jgi:TPR repeat/Glycosyltransferase family 9 (heptosyltransferase)
MPSIFQRLFKRESTSLPTSKPSLSLSSAEFDAVYARAIACASERNLKLAIQLFDQAILLDPSRAEPYYKRANAYKDLDQNEAAIASYDQAIERRPHYAHAYCNRGVVEQALGRMEAAYLSYARAIALDPADFMAPYNRALLMQDCSRWEEAIADYDRAIALNPQFADALYNRAMAQLFLGDFEAGWRGYEWRWVNARRLGIGEARTFKEPRWQGEEIAGKRLLLYAEAGLGDTLQFCRYATLCARSGASVILEVQAPLVGLLGRLEGVSRVTAAGTDPPAFDYQSPLLSLPLAFKTNLTTIPAPPSYLQAEDVQISQWRHRLGPRSRPRIGLAWSGNPRNAIDPRRSIRLADLIEYLPIEFEYYRLQTHVREYDRAALESSASILSFDDELLDFENTAALCACLDIVITVDTSLAHLAGALGRRTWVLLAHTPDFRWLRDRNDSPWYPSLKLYRQNAASDWTGVFERVAADLRSEFRTT